MEIVTVVEIESGLLSKITPFPIFDESKREDVVQQAETFFLSCAKKYGWNENYELDEQGLLEEGMFDNTDCGHPSYYTVHIHWITI